MVADFNREIQSLWALEATKDRKLQAFKDEVEAYEARVEAYEPMIKSLEAQIKVCMAAVANDGFVQVSTTNKVNAP